MSADKGGARPTNILMCIIKGALLASIASIALLLLLALALEKMWLPIESVEYISPALKVIGSAFASMVALRKCTGKRWLIGMAAGAVFSLIAFMSFSIISNTFQVTSAIIADLGLCSASGAITGIILGFKR